MSRKKPKIIAIVGPTASGKTGMAVKLARDIGGEIVSADSRQVYRGMDIGTGKDLAEYGEGVDKVPYHLIDVAEPEEVYNLARFQKEAFAAIDDILSRGKIPIIAGGTGLYAQAIIDNFDLTGVKADRILRVGLEQYSAAELLKKLKSIDPQAYDSLNQSERNNKRRLIRYIEIAKSGQVPGLKDEPRYQALVIGIERRRDEIRQRIEKRLKERLEEEGMIEEVKRLKQQGLSGRRLDSFGLEYRYVNRYLEGSLDYDELVERLSTAIKQFAKRQMTWYRRWQRQGREIRWLSDYDEIKSLVTRFIK